MANDTFIVVSVDGIPAIQARLKTLLPALADAGTDSANVYMLNVLRTYPKPKFVTRKSAYGVTFFTARQRRWFFAALGDGRLHIPYRRTQGIRNNWRVEGEGRQSFIANDAPGVEYVMDDKLQSRHEKKVGWIKVGDILRERNDKIVSAFDAGVKKEMKKRKIT